MTPKNEETHETIEITLKTNDIISLLQESDTTYHSNLKFTLAIIVLINDADDEDDTAANLIMNYVYVCDPVYYRTSEFEQQDLLDWIISGSYDGDETQHTVANEWAELLDGQKEAQEEAQE